MDHATLAPVAQTNLQLYNQLRKGDLSPDDLALVRRAYELANVLYAGAFQSNDKPFISHGVGVASLVTEASLPARFIAAALVHNAYGNGDFGDGKQYTVDDRRRALVSDAVGRDISDMIERFLDSRVTPDTIADFEARFDSLDATERGLVAIELADYAEKFVDDGYLYIANNDWVRASVEQIGDRLIALARRMGHDALARRMEAAFVQVHDAAASVPESLRPTHGQRYLWRIMSLSSRRRTGLVLRESAMPPLRRASRGISGGIHRARVKIAARTRLKRLFSRAI